jgi:hypothetical protein
MLFWKIKIYFKAALKMLFTEDEYQYFEYGREPKTDIEILESTTPYGVDPPK